MRGFGLAIDNLRAASVVLAEGRFVRASTDEHPDSFWGLRGVVAAWASLPDSNSPCIQVSQVYAGVVVRPAEEAALILRTFRDFAPEGIFYDVSLADRRVEILAVVPKSETDKWLAQFGKPLVPQEPKKSPSRK